MISSILDGADQMTDVTDLGEIWVVGQRRRPGGSFPSGGGSGGGGDTGVPQQNELGESEPEEPPPHPCDSPQTALPWNADAAAAAAIEAFLEAAASLGFADAPNGTPSLANREFGRGLSRGPGQSVAGNGVSWGSPVAPNTVSSMTLDMSGITTANYIGDIHSHPNGNPLPSVEDWNGFISNNNAARAYGRTGETFYLYVVAVDPNGGPPTIHVYEDGPREVGSPDPERPTTAGPEVNPEAEPCPGSGD